MIIKLFPFQIADWNRISKESHHGINGTAYWQVFMMGEIRVRTVEYTAGYIADHWCSKGPIILCLDGEMETELEDGRKFTLGKGMSYPVGDGTDAHRSYSKSGCKLFIVD